MADFCENKCKKLSGLNQNVKCSLIVFVTNNCAQNNDEVQEYYIYVSRPIITNFDVFFFSVVIYCRLSFIKN